MSRRAPLLCMYDRSTASRVNPALQSDRLGSRIPGRREQFDPLEPELLEAPLADQAYCPRRVSLATRGGREPVADFSTRVLPREPHQRRPSPAAIRGRRGDDRERGRSPICRSSKRRPRNARASASPYGSGPVSSGRSQDPGRRPPAGRCPCRAMAAAPLDRRRAVPLRERSVTDAGRSRARSSSANAICPNVSAVPRFFAPSAAGQQAGEHERAEHVREIDPHGARLCRSAPAQSSALQRRDVEGRLEVCQIPLSLRDGHRVARNPRSPCSATKSASACIRGARATGGRARSSPARCASRASTSSPIPRRRHRGDRDHRHPGGSERTERGPEVGESPRCDAPEVGFRHDEHVRHLHDPRLQELQHVAGTRLHDDRDGVRDVGHLGLGLADADGLDHDHVERGRERRGGRSGRRRQPAEPIPRRGRADEHTTVGRVEFDPGPVAEQRPARAPRGGIDGEHGDGPPAGAPFGDRVSTATRTFRRRAVR